MRRSRLKRLNEALAEEDKKVPTSRRLCMSFCYEHQVFIAISRIGEEGTSAEIKEVIASFSTFIDTEDEDFMGQEAFAQSLINFLESTHRKQIREVESEFVELLFGIAAKIRMNPKNLRVWFTRGSEELAEEEDENSLEEEERSAELSSKVRRPPMVICAENLTGSCRRSSHYFTCSSTMCITKGVLVTLREPACSTLLKQLRHLKIWNIGWCTAIYRL